MINITGKLPRSIVDSLNRLNVIVSDVQVVGDDIDVTLTTDNTSSTLYAIYVGNGKWVVDELDDVANLFPEIEEGDSISVDMFTKLFVNSINSSLILSFNPLGRVKYGIKEVGKNIADVGRKVADWATDKLYAEDAEKWIRGNGPYRRTFTDARDGKTRTKKDYNAGRVNVGKIESLGKMGHYKVLSGNPATQDFQVWHLYKNGNKIRCLDVKTGLKPQEAQWVYDNNIPNSWSEADWNPEGEIPEKASKIEIGETQEQKNQTEETTEEDNVTETEEVQETNETDNEEDNVTDVDDMDPDTWFEEDNTHEAVTEEEDNVVEEPKKKKRKVAASLIKSSIEDSDSDFGEDIEEDNVIESKPKKKSKYNGCNVTGCVEGDGTVVMASLEEDNVIDSEEIVSSLLITEDLKQFIQHTETLKDVDEKVKEQWNKIKQLLLDISILDKNILKEMTKQDSGTNLTIDFNETHTGQNYTITIEFLPNRLVVTDSTVKPEQAYEHLIQSLEVVKKSLEPKI